MTVLGDRFRLLLTQEAGSVDAVCHEHPAEMAALAKFLAQKAEAAAHRHLAQQQQAQQHNKDGQDGKLLVRYMTGLVKLLCCSSQQVHCAVVGQMARLAYCTPVLEQVAFPLDQHPAAIAAVVNLLRGMVRAPDSTSWGGAALFCAAPPPTLQAEAAAALLVLSSLGRGSKQLVGHHPDAITGLAEAIFNPPVSGYWAAATPGARACPPTQAGASSSQQQQQQQPFMPRDRPAGQQAAGRKRWVSPWLVTVLCVTALVYVGLVVVCGVQQCSSGAGVGGVQQFQGPCWLRCAQPPLPSLPPLVMVHAQTLWQEGPGVHLTILWLLAPGLLRLAVLCWGVCSPSSRRLEHFVLQQQWAAYCAHHLLDDHKANISHVKQDQQALRALVLALTRCCTLSTYKLMCSVLRELGVSVTVPGFPPVAHKVSKVVEPPPPPGATSSWRASLDRTSRRMVKSAGTSTWVGHCTTGTGLCVLLVGVLIVFWQQLVRWPQSSLYRGLQASALVHAGLAWVCSSVLYDAMLYAWVVWSCGAAVVLTLTSSTAGQPRVLRSRGVAVPPPWLLHTLCNDWADLSDGGAYIVRLVLSNNPFDAKCMGDCTSWYIGHARCEWLDQFRRVTLQARYLLWVPSVWAVLTVLAWCPWRWLGWHDWMCVDFRPLARFEVGSTPAWVMATGWGAILFVATCAAWFHHLVFHGVLLPLLSRHVTARPRLLQLAAACGNSWLWAAMSMVLAPLLMVCCWVVAAFSCLVATVTNPVAVLCHVPKALAAISWRCLQWLAGSQSAPASASSVGAVHTQESSHAGESGVSTHVPQPQQQQRTVCSKIAAAPAAPPPPAPVAAGKSKLFNHCSSKQPPATGAVPSCSSSSSSSMSKGPLPGASAPTSPMASLQAATVVNTSMAAGSSEQVVVSSSTANTPVIEPALQAVVAPAAGVSASGTSSMKGSTSGTTQQQQSGVVATVSRRARKQQQQQQGEVQNQQDGSQPASPSAPGSATSGSTIKGFGCDSNAGAAPADGSALPPKPPAAQQAAGPVVVPLAVTEEQQQQPQVLIPSSSTQVVPSTASSGLHLVQLVAAKRAAMAAATAAVQDAAGQPLTAKYTAAAKAAAAAVQAVGGVEFVTASSIVAEAAAAAMGLLQEPGAAAGSTGVATAACSGGGQATAPATAAACRTGAATGLLQEPPAPAGSTDVASRPLQEPPATAGSAANTTQSSTTHSKPAPKKPRQPECVVCMDARACVRTQPCGHQVLCRGCAEQVASSKGKGECPMCRAVVEQYVVVPRPVRG